MLLVSALWLACPAWAQTTTWRDADLTQTSRGDTHDRNIRPTTPEASAATGSVTLRQGMSDTTPEPRVVQPSLPRYVPSEFERYVQRQSGSGPESPTIERFGARLLFDLSTVNGATDPLPSVPADYLIKSGDEVRLTLWGSVDADLRLVVDRNGRIAVPRVGSIAVAGVRQADLDSVIGRRVSQVFRNYQISAGVGQLRAIRVFVTGYAQQPGSITLPGLSTALHAIMRAGGPSAAGSFRDIQLRRGGKTTAQLDLYTLLTKGDRGSDLVLQPDDVIYVGPVGPQVGLIGSVNQPAVFELLPDETTTDLLRFAGGFSAVADRSRLTLERLADRNSGRVVQLTLPAEARTALGAGDLVRAFSAIDLATARGKRNQRVRIEGEVTKPGEYVLPPGSTIADALQAAGGMTQGAYVYGTELNRESVRVSQQENYDRALRDMETDMTRNSATRRTASAEEVASQTASVAATQRLVDRLRLIRPTGRVVLQIEPTATALPDLRLEDGDRIHVPSYSSSVGIFGSVFNGGSFLYQSDQRIGDYLQQAGGPTHGADTKSIFVIRANGTVVSARQSSSFWRNGDLNSTIALPGDTIFVPEEMDKTTFTQSAKDWTQILYQFGLGVAGIKAVGL
ncbi:MAG: SLBB domain-containing protein [Proteobacteria bacterium]|nr:SLBB domain-containing protein [Pseudomonadota bacterium]